MNSELIKFISLSFLLITTGAIAADDNASTLSAGIERPDIQRIVSVTPVPSGCQVEPVTMVYIDSQGAGHTITYKTMGTCQGGI